MCLLSPFKICIRRNIRYQDPFEEYKKRLANKLAKRAASDQAQERHQTGKKDNDDINWFGVKVGSENPTTETTSGAVGKYLTKRPRTDPETTNGVDDSKKKRKIGFGNFDGW